MFETEVAAWVSIFRYPVISIILFVLIGVGLIIVFSGKRWWDSLVGIFRVFSTFITTPFIFIRDALALVRNAGASEPDYYQSRTFMLFRYSRLQYLGVLLTAVAILTSGLTATLLVFDPTDNLKQEAAIQETLRSTQTDISNEKQSIEARDARIRGDLERRRVETQTKHAESEKKYMAVRDEKKFSGGMIDAINEADSVAGVQRFRSDVQELSGCPGDLRWNGWTAEDCRQLQSFVTRLFQSRLAERTAFKAFEDVQEALSSEQSARRASVARVQTLEMQAKELEAQRASVSVFRLEWWSDRALAAVNLLSGTIGSVVLFIWLSAILIDIINWLILMMRSLEKMQAAKLEKSAADYGT